MRTLSLVLIGLLLAATAQAGEPKWKTYAPEEALIVEDEDGRVYKYNPNITNRWVFSSKNGVLRQKLEGTHIYRIVKVM